MKTKGKKRTLSAGNVFSVIALIFSLIVLMLVLSSCGPSRSQLNSIDRTMMLHDSAVRTIAIDSIKANLYKVEIAAYDGKTLLYTTIEYVIGESDAQIAVDIRSDGINEYTAADSIKHYITPVQILSYGQ